MTPLEASDWCTRALALLVALVPDGDELLPLRVPLAPDEAEWFVRGWDHGLYPVADCPTTGLPGTCLVGRRDHFHTTSGKHRHLLTRGAAGWTLSREYVTHLGAFARAVLDYGYATAGSQLSHYSQYRRDLITKRRGGSYEIDAAFPAAAGVGLLIEAKADARQVARWAAAIDAGAGAGALVTIGFKEVEYVLELAPDHLWLVGPGTVDPASHVWAVEVDGTDASFARVADVPPPP